MSNPYNISVDNIKPLNLSVDSTSALFQKQSIMYDQPATEWDQPNTFWGGSDRKGGSKPLNIGVDKP